VRYQSYQYTGECPRGSKIVSALETQVFEDNIMLNDDFLLNSLTRVLSVWWSPELQITFHNLYSNYSISAISKIIAEFQFHSVPFLIIPGFPASLWL